MSDINSNKLPVITISREYGAGGSSIAEGLSKILGIPWYDRDFVKFTSEISGYSEEEIDEEGEELSGSQRLLDVILNNVAAYNSSHDAIFKAQKESMLELAESPCILVGRCGNIILREAGVESFDIFLYADFDVRLKRAEQLVKDPKMDLKKYVEKRDALRENYYKAYTKHPITRAQDYNICLDTGAFGYDKCISLLAQLIKDKYQI